MVAPTRFPSGLQVWGGRAALAEMGLPDRTKFVHFAEEFIEAGDFVAATPTNWTRTVVGTGTTVIASEFGGVVTLTNSAGAADQISVQQKNTSFLFALDQKLFFKARLSLSDVSLSNMFMGLSILDTTPIGAVSVEETGVSDGVFFLKISGSPLLRAFVRTGGITKFSNTNLFTMVNARMLDIAWFWDGLLDNGNRDGGEIKFFVKEDVETTQEIHWTEVGSFRISTFADLPAVALSVNMSIQNGEAVAKIMKVDNVLAHQARIFVE